MHNNQKTIQFLHFIKENTGKINKTKCFIVNKDANLKIRLHFLNTYQHLLYNILYISILYIDLYGYMHGGRNKMYAVRILDRFVLIPKCISESVFQSVMQDSTTPWTVAHQTSLSMEFRRQEQWSGLPFSFPGDLLGPEMKPRSPALQADSLPSEPSGKSPRCKSNS